MKRIVGALAAAGIVTGLVAELVLPAAADRKSASSLALAKQNAEAHARLVASAPGDAYFGRLKMSYLGINNVFKDQIARAGDHTVDPQIANKLKDADDSLQAWARQYPHDPQLARSYFLAAAAYKKVWTKPSQEKAWQYMHVVTSRFPVTYFGKQVKKDIAVGFTEHYFADALPCPIATAIAMATPLPDPTATPAGKRSKNATPAPTEAPTPEPTESSSPAPEPTPTRTAAPGQPKIDLIVAACTSPATPSPEPTLTPAAALGSAEPSSAPLPASTTAPEAMPSPLPSPAATRAS